MKNQLLDQPESMVGTPYYNRSRRYNRYIQFALFFGVAVFMLGRLSSEDSLLILTMAPLVLVLIFMLVFTLLSVINLIKSYRYGEDVAYRRVILLVSHGLIFILLSFVCVANAIDLYQEYVSL